MPRLSAQGRAALEQVAADRVKYGSPYPHRDRQLQAQARHEQRPHAVLHAFILDGSEAPGPVARTFSSLEERGLLRVRREDVEEHLAPERTLRYTTMTGESRTHVVPARTEPVDPGWQARLELTDAGRAALAASQPAAGGQHG